MNFDEIIENMKNVKEDLKTKDEKIRKYEIAFAEISKKLDVLVERVKSLVEDEVPVDEPKVEEAPEEEKTENLFG